MEIKPKKIISNDWRMHYGNAITDTEYNEICTNLYDFFYLIKTWHDNSKKGFINEQKIIGESS